MKKLLIELEDNLHHQLKLLALKQRTSLKDLIIQALKKEVKRLE